jgi:hypothetical protein
MTGKATRVVGFDAQVNGRDCCIEFERVTTFVTDHHYGADADGNRGMSVTEVDEDYAEHIVLLEWVGGIDGTHELTTALPDLQEPERGEVARLVDAFLATHEPEAPEPDDDEPDDAPPDDTEPDAEDLL